MKENEGYINIVAVMQKYLYRRLVKLVLQSLKIIEIIKYMSVMAQDLLTTYKLGWEDFLLSKYI